MGDASRKRAAEEPAHDILAAEAFAMPAPDPAFRHDLVVPQDPAGIAEPHDILAAEAYAMPAPGRPSPAPTPVSVRRFPRWAWMPGAGLAAIWIRRRRLAR
jgi:hypothetical protein